MARWSARARTAAALLAVVGLAAVFRLSMLDTVPPGLYLDEVLSAQHALAWRLAAHKAWFEGTPLLAAGWVETSNLYLAAAGLLAVSHWAARTGRDGWDQVAMTALQVAALASLAHGLGRNRLAWSALAGALLGGCLYTYVASRLVFVQVGTWLAWEAFASARKGRILVHAGLALALALLCAAPYYAY